MKSVLPFYRKKLTTNYKNTTQKTLVSQSGEGALLTAVILLTPPRSSYVRLYSASKASTNLP